MHSVVRPRLLAFAFAALAGASAAFAQNTVTLDLQTTGQWNAHFRRLANVSGGSAAQNASGFFRVDANTTNTSPAISHAAYVFDTTPADATLATQSAFDTTAPVTVSLDVRSTNAASVALIFADAENPSNNVLALFDLKTGNDTVRFYKDGARNTAGTTFSVGTQVGATTTAATTAEPAAGALFTNFTVTLDLNGSTPTLLVEVDGVANPITYTFYKGNIDWARTTVIVRIDDGGGATVGNTPVDLDNVIIQSGAAPASPVTANTAARLEGSSARTIAAGRLLVVANPAVDFDVPRQTLTYALTQAPAGATIDAEGTILWRPDAADVSATPYTFTTDVSDNGSPVRTATNTFDVTVTSTVSLGAFTRDLDFLAAGQFDSFFRSVTDVGGGTRGQLDTRLVLDATSNGGNQSQAWLFDTTPADPAAATQTAFPVSAPVTVSFQARVRASDSSLAVLFADSRNALNNVSAVLNLRNGTDLLRFFRDGSLTRRSTTAGTQVGSDNVLTTTAEPLYPEYLPVTVTLSASGSTPTLSVKVGDAAPIVSAFAAGDLNWTTTLVLLRLNDANSATNTALQLNNLVVGGATPVTPVPPTYTAAPGVNGNLLTTNPSFESGTLSNYSGTYTLPGWDGKNLAFAQHSLVTGSVAAGTTTDGMKKISQRIGGELVTAVATRAAATAGVTYEFAFDQSVLRRTFPNQKLGTFRYLEFFDDAGIRIQQAWGTTNDYKVAYDGPLNTWQTWTLRGVAPVGTASVGVRIENPTGQFVSSSETYVDDRDVEIDHVRLTVIPDTAERIAVRRAPRLVEPGKTATLKLHALALSPRTLRATLLDSGNTARATAS
ncbi:MAG: hypothetical protein H7067_02650, partial [Burkholderiales bacterium]|nr:hypothetical protein [Opitutaceae bacterium]